MDKSRRVRSVALLLLALAAPSGIAIVAGAGADAAEPPAWLGDLNAASDGSVAIVVMACHEFHPDLLRVQSGQEVLFQWDDPCVDSAHTVTSSGSTLDPDQDLNKPVSPMPARCFDSSHEPTGRILSSADRQYHVRLLYAGIVMRDLEESLAYQEIPPFIPPDEVEPLCPTDASFRFPEGVTGVDAYEAIVPYFCRLHAREDVPAGQGMRAAIVLTM